MTPQDRSIISVTTLSHALVHTYELSIPILMTIWMDLFGATEAVLGGVVTLGYGLFGLGALPSGILADRLGSRNLMIACLMGMSASFLLLSLSPGLVTIALALVVWGLAASMHHPASLTLISKGVSRRGRALGYHGMAGNIGIAFGPLLTTLLLDVVGWRMVTGLLAVPAALASIFALQVHFEEQDPSDAEADSRGTPGISSVGDFFGRTGVLLFSSFGIVFAIVILEGLFYRGALTFLPDLFEGLPQVRALQWGEGTLKSGRYIYSGMLTVGILGQYFGGRWSDRIVTHWSFGIPFALLAVLSILFIPVSGMGLAPLLAVSVILGLLLFFLQPLYQAAVAEHSPADQRGLAYGYTYLGVFGVGALGAAITGYLLSHFSLMGYFLFLALVAGGAAVLTWFLVLRGGAAPRADREEKLAG